MCLEVDVAAASIRDVGVALRRPEIRMPEHLLHGAQVRSSLEEMCRERMAQEVRMDASGLEAGTVGELAQDEERAGARERSASRVQEELRPIAAVEVRPPEGEIAAHCLCRGTPEWDEPLLSALSEHAHHALLERDAVLLQPDRLGDTQTGAVQELHERPVAQRPRGRPDRGVDQTLRLGG